MSRTLPGPEVLVPHAPPMRMLDRVCACDADALEGEASVGADNPFAGEEGVAPVAALELMAQAAAAWVGWHGRARGDTPRPGYLVNVRELILPGDAIEVGATLRVRVRAGDGDDGLRQFEGTVWRADDEAPTARARFAVYRPPAGGRDEGAP